MPTCLKNIGKLLNPKPDGSFEEISDAAILFDREIIACGSESEILPEARVSGTEIVDAEGMLVTPGLVDSHTHPAFAEFRAGEFELRNRGSSYKEIAASGGGIRSSVRSLRALSEDELVLRMLPRLDTFLRYGITTVEAKSGYGLSLDQELKQLRALKRCGDQHPLELIPTLLAAHEIPDEYRENRRKYLDVVVNEIIPAAAENKLAQFCDVFCERGVFSVEESRVVLETGKRYGLIPKIHADQLTYTGGAELAAEVGAASAEHLDFISEIGIERMVEAGVVFTLLPGAVVFLGLTRYPPARRILEMGGKVALATDFNPGSSPTQNLALIITLACVFCKMTIREALWSATLGGAYALRLNHRIGSLHPQKQADFVVWDYSDERLIPYNYGMNMVREVYKNGSLVIRKGMRV
ncbi:MAG: imidazolonepropionase [bacterium]|nr:imidazolonepropionase [bacterium]